jgi:hypothetical protein
LRTIAFVGAVLLALLSGCGEGTESEGGLFFPTYVHDPDEPLPGATLEGIVTASDGCIFLDDTGSEMHLLLWPGGWSSELKDGQLNVYDEDGQVVASEGEIATFGGGERRSGEVAEVYPDGTPQACRSGPVWLVSGVAK